ncbi:MAG TPA: divalent-cation tolerance protein CutA [Terracidiphilus sp.]|nr:divalent-cation tolerance protein CutA [Terracidiphilus sp.]
MPQADPEARIVLTTAADPDEAARLARSLVEEGLAACATILPGAQSIYHWEGKVEHAAEVLVLIKTRTPQLEALEARLHALHSYLTPEFLVLPVEAGSAGYLEWLQSSLGPR